MLRECLLCEAEFETRHAGSHYCPECRDYIRTGKPVLWEDEPSKSVKPLDSWIAEANACGMSYGTYRAARRLGFSFEELNLS